MKNFIFMIATMVFLIGCADPLAGSKQAEPVAYGYVQMRFDISVLGRPVNIKVVKSAPDQRFEQEAIKALSKWKYAPKVENGVAVKQHGVVVQLEFRLDEAER